MGYSLLSEHCAIPAQGPLHGHGSRTGTQIAGRMAYLPVTRAFPDQTRCCCSGNIGQPIQKPGPAAHRQQGAPTPTPHTASRLAGANPPVTPSAETQATPSSLLTEGAGGLPRSRTASASRPSRRRRQRRPSPLRARQVAGCRGRWEHLAQQPVARRMTGRPWLYTRRDGGRAVGPESTRGRPTPSRATRRGGAAWRFRRRFRRLRRRGRCLRVDTRRRCNG
jgi:hypothetical protein